MASPLLTLADDDLTLVFLFCTQYIDGPGRSCISRQLNSPGGSVWDALLIAVMLGSIPDAITAVRKTDICESACFGIFAVGRRKYLETLSQPLTQLGVHSFSVLAFTADGTFGQNKTPLASAQMLWTARRLKAIGVPDSVIGKMVTTPPQKMSYLTISEVKAMGTALAGVDSPGSTIIRAPRDPDPLMVAAIVKNIDVTDERSGQDYVLPGGRMVLVEDGCQSREGYCQVVASDLAWHLRPRRRCSWPISLVADVGGRAPRPLANRLGSNRA